MPLVDRDVLEFLIEHAVATEHVDVKDEDYGICLMCSHIQPQHDEGCAFPRIIAKAKEALNAPG